MANANQPTGSVAEHSMKHEDTFVEDVDIDKNDVSGSGYVMSTYHSYSPEYSSGVEKKLLRRIDLRIMPLVVLIYIFSYLDRNSVSRGTSPDSSFNADDMIRLRRLVCMVCKKIPTLLVLFTILLLPSSRLDMSLCNYHPQS